MNKQLESSLSAKITTPKNYFRRPFLPVQKTILKKQEMSDEQLNVQLLLALKKKNQKTFVSNRRLEEDATRALILIKNS